MADETEITRADKAWAEMIDGRDAEIRKLLEDIEAVKSADRQKHSTIVELESAYEIQMRKTDATEAEAVKLRGLLKECADRLERCCRAAGSDAETAAAAVWRYRAATGGGTR